MKSQRWRIVFSKTAVMRYTGHLDLILTWERTFRRSGLPLSYSEGYSPRPVINLAAPLPLGFTSQGEIGDFWLSEIVTLKEFETALKPALPPGISINQIEEIPQLHGDKLPTLVEAASYSIRLTDEYPNLSGKIDWILAQQEIHRERRGKRYDLRQLIHSLTIAKDQEPGTMRLHTKMDLLPGATGRPDEILKELHIPAHQASICRAKIFLKSDCKEE